MPKKKAEEVAPGEDILSGVDERSTRAVLYARLREAAKRLYAREDERVAKMQEIEERVRERFQGVEPDMRAITVMCTKQEMIEGADFLENFEDIMPMALHRLYAGMQTVAQANGDDNPS